jgi:copper resistance protein C
MRIVSKVTTLLLAAGVAGLFSLFSASVLAHSTLTASSPGNQSTVVSPETLELTFNEGVRMLRLTLVHGASHNIEFGFQPSTEAKNTYIYDLPMLMMGAHTVNWTAIGSDGHPNNGTFIFTVGTEGAQATTEANSAAGHHHH